MATQRTEAQDTYISWLKDAHAMENALINTLEGHIKDADSMPQLQARLQQHLEETRNHASLVEGCLTRLGEDPSGLKAGMAKLTGVMQGAGTSLMGGKQHDPLVKNGLADFSAEEFEVASYKALITAAQALGDTETGRVAQQIMLEDQAMADWLDQHLPMVVQQTLQGQMVAH